MGLITRSRCEHVFSSDAVPTRHAAGTQALLQRAVALEAERVVRVGLHDLAVAEQRPTPAAAKAEAASGSEAGRDSRRFGDDMGVHVTRRSTAHTHLRFVSGTRRRELPTHPRETRRRDVPRLREGYVRTGHTLKLRFRVVGRLVVGRLVRRWATRAGLWALGFRLSAVRQGRTVVWAKNLGAGMEEFDVDLHDVRLLQCCVRTAR